VMDIRRADHVALLVEEVERSRRFYMQVLGMQEIPRPPTFDFPGAWLTRGNFQIHLIGEEVAGRARAVNPGYLPAELARGRVTHLAFEVDDLAAAMQHLGDQGVPIVGGPQPRGDGVEQLYICDPDGYVIEIFAWAARR
jgi:catechol 2,3-dioxygenase-like lactoylglutathione lyase family enzyme